MSELLHRASEARFLCGPPGLVLPESAPVSATTASVRPRWQNAALRLGTSALLLAVGAAVLRADEVWLHMRRFVGDAGVTWGLAVVGFLSLHVAGALKWRFFLSTAGASISTRWAVRAYGAGLFANLCLPSLIGGDVLRAGIAMSASDCKEAIVVGSIIERLADLLALAFLVVVGAVWSMQTASALAAPRASVTVILAVIGSAAGGVLIVALILQRRFEHRLPGGLGRRLAEARRALRAYLDKPDRVAIGFLACMGIQGSFVLVNAAIGRALGIDLGLGVWFLVWPLAKLVAMLPVSLGGLGVREFAFAALVSPFAVAAEVAVAQSLIWQSVLIAGGLMAGAYVLVTAGRTASERPRGLSA